MKKRFQMPSREAFRALYAPGTEDFARRVSDTLASLPDHQTEDQPKMKKKLSLGLVLAIVFVLAACAALALSNNVFGIFADRYNPDSGEAQLLKTLDQSSVVSTKTQTVAAATNQPFEAAAFTLSQSYYDGENLYLGYTLKAPSNIYDYTWRPTEDELGAMEKLIVSGANDEQADGQGVVAFGDQAFVDEMVRIAGEQGASGAIVYSTYLGDGVYLSGTTKYLDLIASDDSTLPDGTQIGYKRFQTPLIDEARNQDELSLYTYLYRHPAYHYFDGANWYYKTGERTADPMAFAVPRNAQNTVTDYPFSASFQYYNVTGTVSISGISLIVKLDLAGKNGYVPCLDESSPGAIYDYSVLLHGDELSPIDGGGYGLGTPDCGFEYTFPLPEGGMDELTLLPLCADESGVFALREEEKIVVSLASPAPTVLPQQ